MNDIPPMALFRYSVLAPLVSRAGLQHGELKAILRELAARDYDIPGSRNSRLGEKTVEASRYVLPIGEDRILFFAVVVSICSVLLKKLTE